MKTPDEIKKGLDCCMAVQVGGPCPGECPLLDLCKSGDDGAVQREIFALIQQLEAERDALMEQAKYAGVCDMCKHEHTPLNELPCKECSLSNRKFEWRGVQKEG